MTKTIHTEPSDTISPLRPELSQKGKTVLITGGATGLGYPMCRAFAQAGVSTIVICNRRAITMATAASKLMGEFADKGLRVICLACDVGKGNEVESLWENLENGGIVVDILVLNAGVNTVSVPILKLGIDQSWREFETNVRGHIHFAQKFYNQKHRDASKQLTLVNVSSGAIHGFQASGRVPHYSLTKNSGTLAIQQIAKDVDPEDMQVVSFHPGLVFTPMGEGLGVSKDAYPWDSEDLPGHFSVWAASNEAKFLHGRFVWATWDVDEMKGVEFRQRLEEDPSFLKIGVHGL
ncbi:NAD(P)-binding protein [Thozetella sp. PMI_491]|nr:NAD(P)-binding protein [Thozetella sp. PMI_491]